MSLKIPTPATLKRYGIYAVLSFFMCLCSYLILDDRSHRQDNLEYERRTNKELQQELIKQMSLQKEQQELLKESQENTKKADTVKNLSVELAKRSKPKKKR